MIRSALLAACLALGAAPAFAQDAARASRSLRRGGLRSGLGRGFAPAFALSDSTGTRRTLSDLAGPSGLVIYFNRSLDWCPICLRQTIELNEAVDAFNAAGWGVAVLTYDPVDTLARVKDQRGLEMSLLSDPESQVIDAFDVRDPIYADPEHIAHGVPYPITFALTPDARVVGKYWHEAGLGDEGGYAVRISAEDVLADLD